MESLDSAISKALKIRSSTTTEEFMKIYSSKQNPNLYFVAEYILSIVTYDWPQFLINHFLPDVKEPIEFDRLIELLASIDDIQLKIEQMNASVADSFFLLSTSLPMAQPEGDLKKIQEFDSANTLHEAFKNHENIDDYIELLSSLSPLEADLLQAVLACEMAGLKKATRTIKKEFTKNMFLQGNQFYASLMMRLSDAIGRKDSVKQAGKNGNDSKHRINRQVRTKAVELYLDGSFHNPRHATKQLLPTVAKISSELGSALEWENNGFDRLYGWLRAAKKAENV